MHGRVRESYLVMSEKEANKIGKSKSPVSVWGKHQTLTFRIFFFFFVQALRTLKETILHEKFYEPVVMPDFMMSGNSFYQKRTIFQILPRSFQYYANLPNNEEFY